MGSRSSELGAIRLRSWLLLALLASVPANASFRLIDGSADGGGRHSQGSRFAVEGTAGQADTELLAGTRFRLYGGFWSDGQGSALPDLLFQDSFED